MHISLLTIFAAYWHCSYKQSNFLKNILNILIYLWLQIKKWKQPTKPICLLRKTALFINNKKHHTIFRNMFPWYRWTQIVGEICGDESFIRSVTKILWTFSSTSAVYFSFSLIIVRMRFEHNKSLWDRKLIV